MLKTVLSLGANGSMEGKGAAEDIALLCMILELAKVYELCMRHYSLSAFGQYSLLWKVDGTKA